MKYDVFISYARQDFQYAEALSQELQAQGKTFFSDRIDIQEGQDFASIISSAIEQCQIFLYINSSNSYQSRWVQNELKYALGLKKKIIVVNVCNEIIPENLSKYCSLSLTSFSTEEVKLVVKEIITSCFPSRPKTVLKGFKKEHSIISQSPSCTISSSPKANEKERFTKKTKPRLLKKWVLFITIIIFLIFILKSIFFVGSSKDGISKGYKGVSSSGITFGSRYEATDKSLSNNDTIPYDSVIVESDIFYDPSETIDDFTDYGDDCLNNEFSSESKTLNSIFYWCIFIFVLAFIKIVLYRRANRKYIIKVHNRNCKDCITLRVDGVWEGRINPLEVKCIHRKKGEYILTIQMETDETKVKNIHQTFDKEHNNQILPIEFKQTRNTDFITYRCFIGGSTSIVNERNAARSVLSILYNQYEKYNFYITVHTFEDFKNKHKIEGHQYEYDEFIRKKANCAIFIICKYVGKKTLEEYKVAVDTFEATNEERPTIFVYNDISENNQDESINEFRRYVDSKKAYWRDYKDIETLMLKIKDDISAELADVLEMRPNLNKKDSNF